MELTRRQSKILIWIVKDYIELAKPISSEFLGKRHKIKISSPMIRIEMQRLTEKGFLEKPHFSAGRIPTDEAYRFFVNSFLEKRKRKEKFSFEKKFDDLIRLMQDLTREMAKKTKAFILSYLKDEMILFKEGWEVLKEPEFKNGEIFSKFLEFLVEFEKNLKEFDLKSEIEVFIGKENPFPKGKDFSLIFSKFPLPKNKEGILALTGPKRMDYFKNISLLESLREFFKKINV